MINLEQIYVDVDATKLQVCHNIRIPRNKVFEGAAARGKSSMGWFYGAFTRRAYCLYLAT